MLLFPKRLCPWIIYLYSAALRGMVHKSVHECYLEMTSTLFYIWLSSELAVISQGKLKRKSFKCHCGQFNEDICSVHTCSQRENVKCLLFQFKTCTRENDRSRLRVLNAYLRCLCPTKTSKTKWPIVLSQCDNLYVPIMKGTKLYVQERTKRSADNGQLVDQRLIR